MGAQSTTTQTVIDHYSAVARGHGEQDIQHANKVAQAFGYNLLDLTAGANLGLSCSNPLALANLIPVYASRTIIGPAHTNFTSG